MLYLLDTNALSELARKRPSIEQRMTQALATARVFTCVVAVGEILQGVERIPIGRKREILRQQVQAVLAALQCEPIPISAAVIYAEIKTYRQAVGRPMESNDLWIAATAAALGATLVTRDADFVNVPGLKVEDWTL